MNGKLFNYAFFRYFMKKEVGSRKITFITVIILIIALFIAVFTLLNKNKDNIISEKECETDSDCVKQRTTCCPCSMGGKEVCMSKKNASIFENKIKECGSGLICPALYACEPEKKCGCVDGRCQ
jgi:hypothetical protein